MNEEARYEGADHPELTLYISQKGEGEDALCSFFPPTNGQAFREVRKGIPYGFFLFESDDKVKHLYSDDVIIPIDRGRSPDIEIRNGEPCILDSEGCPHFFIKPFQEFKEDLLNTARQMKAHEFFRFYYKKQTNPDGTKYETNDMVAFRSNREMEYVNAAELYGLYQYGMNMEDLLATREAEVASDFLSPMQYMADPEYIWNYYKDVIIPEMYSTNSAKQFAIENLSMAGGNDCFIQFYAENRKDITGHSSFYLTPEHARKMNVDTKTIYEQSVKNLERRLKEEGLYPEKFEEYSWFEFWTAPVDDYPGYYFCENEAWATPNNIYGRSVLCLPEARKRLDEIFPDGYRIAAQGGRCVAYPLQITLREDKIEELKTWEAQKDGWRTPENKKEPEKETNLSTQGKKQKGFLDGLFTRKKMKASIL